MRTKQFIASLLLLCVWFSCGLEFLETGKQTKQAGEKTATTVKQENSQAGAVEFLEVGKEKKAEAPAPPAEVQFLDVKSSKENVAASPKVEVPKEKVGGMEFLDLNSSTTNTKKISEVSKPVVASNTVTFLDLDQNATTPVKAAHAKAVKKNTTAVEDGALAFLEVKPKHLHRKTKTEDKTVTFLDLNSNATATEASLPAAEKHSNDSSSTIVTPPVEGAVTFLDLSSTSPKNTTASATRSEANVTVSTPVPPPAEGTVTFLELNTAKAKVEPETITTSNATVEGTVAFLELNATKAKAKPETIATSNATTEGTVTFLELHTTKGKAKPETITVTNTTTTTKSDQPQVAFLDLSPIASSSAEATTTTAEKQKKTVLITGVGSAVGASLVQLLTQENHPGVVYEVVGVLQSSADSLEQLKVHGVANNITLLVADLSDGLRVSDVIGEVRPQIVFHLYGEQTYSEHHPLVSVHGNVQGTLHLLESLRRHGLLNTTVVFAGSSSEYGRSVESITLGNGIPETTKLDPVSSDGISKVAAESLLRQYHTHHNIPVVIGRVFAHFTKSVISTEMQESCKQIALMETGASNVFKYSPVNVMRDYVHVRDIARAFYLLSTKGVAGEAYNIGRGEAIASKDVLTELLRLTTATNYKTSKVHSNLRSHVYEKSIIADITKLTSTTGWKPEIAFKDILLEELNYWRSVTKQ